MSLVFIFNNNVLCISTRLLQFILKKKNVRLCDIPEIARFNQICTYILLKQRGQHQNSKQQLESLDRLQNRQTAIEIAQFVARTDFIHFKAICI